MNQNIRHLTSSVLFALLTIGIPLLTIRSFALDDPATTMPEKPPQIPQWAEAEKMMIQLGASERVPLMAKKEVGKQWEIVKKEYNAVWAPWEKAWSDQRAIKIKLEKSDQELTEFSKELDRTQPAADDRAGIIAWNARLATYNNRVKESNKKTELSNKAWLKKVAEVQKPIMDWMTKPTLKEFNQVVGAVLAGKLEFKEGLAWNQLVAAAAGLRDPVFDNAKGGDSSGAVDARGVKPWAPGEREKELQKPRVQPPKPTK